MKKIFKKTKNNVENNKLFNYLKITKMIILIDFKLF